MREFPKNEQVPRTWIENGDVMAFYNNLGSTICQSMGWNEDMWSSGSLDKLNCKMRKKVPIDSLQILPRHGNHLLIILHIHKVGNSGKSLYIYIYRVISYIYIELYYIYIYI